MFLFSHAFCNLHSRCEVDGRTNGSRSFFLVKDQSVCQLVEDVLVDSLKDVYVNLLLISAASVACTVKPTIKPTLQMAQRNPFDKG